MEADLDKARKCLQKAFSLAGGRTDVKEAEDAGSALSDIYRELVQEIAKNGCQQMT